MGKKKVLDKDVMERLVAIVGWNTAQAIASGDPEVAKLVDSKVRAMQEEYDQPDDVKQAVENELLAPWVAGQPLQHTEFVGRGMTLEGARTKGFVKTKPVDISTRITWDQYGMQLATTAALRADCRRRQVGAVLMAEDHSVISMGYNGGPSKGKSCLEGQCPRGLVSKEEAPGNSRYDEGLGTCVALHAEWNVLLRTSWDQFEGSTLYVTHKPCHICSVLISGTRIRRVVAPGYDWASYL